MVLESSAAISVNMPKGLVNETRKEREFSRNLLECESALNMSLSLQAFSISEELMVFQSREQLGNFIKGWARTSLAWLLQTRSGETVSLACSWCSRCQTHIACGLSELKKRKCTISRVGRKYWERLGRKAAGGWELERWQRVMQMECFHTLQHINFHNLQTTFHLTSPVKPAGKMLVTSRFSCLFVQQI